MSDLCTLSVVAKIKGDIFLPQYVGPRIIEGPEYRIQPIRDFIVFAEEDEDFRVDENFPERIHQTRQSERIFQPSTQYFGQDSTVGSHNSKSGKGNEQHLSPVSSSTKTEKTVKNQQSSLSQSATHPVIKDNYYDNTKILSGSSFSSDEPKIRE